MAVKARLAAMKKAKEDKQRAADEAKKLKPAPKKKANVFFRIDTPPGSPYTTQRNDNKGNKGASMVLAAAAAAAAKARKQSGDGGGGERGGSGGSGRSGGGVPHERQGRGGCLAADVGCRRAARCEIAPLHIERGKRAQRHRVSRGCEF